MVKIDLITGDWLIATIGIVSLATLLAGCLMYAMTLDTIASRLCIESNGIWEPRIEMCFPNGTSTAEIMLQQNVVECLTHQNGRYYWNGKEQICQEID